MMDETLSYSEWMQALFVWREARSEPYIAKVALAATVWNRLMDERGRWPRNMTGVLLQGGQYAPMTDVTSGVAMDFPRTDRLSDAEQWEACVRACREGLNNDVTHGANYYHGIPAGRPYPRWADATKETGSFGRFRFYRL